MTQQHEHVFCLPARALLPLLLSAFDLLSASRAPPLLAHASAALFLLLGITKYTHASF
jgi:hypothetical protein